MPIQSVQAKEPQPVEVELEKNVIRKEWDDKPPYFMQITLVTAEDFTIRLIADNINTKKNRKFKVKEIRNDDKETMDEVSITIKKKAQFGETPVNIDEGHDNIYKLVLCDGKNTDNLIPNVTGINVSVLTKESEFPPRNINYKPNPIDISTKIQVKDDENDCVKIYWQIPSNSFGEISYKILLNDDEEKKEKIIKTLPFIFIIIHSFIISSCNNCTY